MLKPASISLSAVCGLLLAACETAGPAPVSEADIAEAITDYERTGETQSCLSVVRIDEIDPVTERIWLVELKGGEVYLNTVSSGCSGADSAFTYLLYDIPGSLLCRGEIIRVMEQTSDLPRGSCALGEYERLAPAGE